MKRRHYYGPHRNKKDCMGSCMPTYQITQIKRTIFKKDKLPKLTQEEIENLNRAIVSKDIKFIIKSTSHKEEAKTRLFHY